MKTIILLHGALGGSDQLIPLQKELKLLSVKSILFDFSGHHQTPFRTGFGVSQFSDELKDFIIANNLVKPSVFGYSLGGYVALWLASQNPAFLGSICTLGTKFEWNVETSEKEIKGLNPDLITQKVPKFAESLKARHGSSWNDLVLRTAHMISHLGQSPLLTKEVLSSISNYIALGLGDRDAMVSLDETVYAFKQVKNGSMYMLPETGHPIEKVDAGLLARILATLPD